MVLHCDLVLIGICPEFWLEVAYEAGQMTGVKEIQPITQERACNFLLKDEGDKEAVGMQKGG